MPIRADFIRFRALEKALEIRSRIDSPFDSPVDVFDAVHRENLWLLFQPLDNLYGIYCRADGAAGIVVNVKVQPSMQRFTAAHELGHHAFGHEPSVDRVSEIQSFSGLTEKELEAQFFAAEFLMPIAAVNKIAAELKVDQQSIEPLDVYQMALHLGTSYSATVTRLQTLGWITANRALDFRDTQPQEIKRSIAQGVLRDNRSDIWLVDRRATRVNAQVGDYLRLTLPEIPSSGYRWRIGEHAAIQIENDEFVQIGHKSIIGGSGSRIFGISAQESFNGKIKCVLERAWAPGNPHDAYELPVEFRHRETPGVYAEQIPALEPS